jgi:hypothetical protein
LAAHRANSRVRIIEFQAGVMIDSKLYYRLDLLPGFVQDDRPLTNADGFKNSAPYIALNEIFVEDPVQLHDRALEQGDRPDAEGPNLTPACSARGAVIGKIKRFGQKATVLRWLWVTSL